MTNAEKARILSNKGCLDAYISKNAESLNPTEEDRKRLSIYGACLEAMQWKDEQHAKEKQKLIDEACKWLELNDSYAKPTHLQVDRLREYLNNIK